MNYDAFLKIQDSARTDACFSDSVKYLTERFSFIGPSDFVLICLPNSDPYGIGAIVREACTARGAKSRFWGEDLRWNTLLKIAFLSRATVIVGLPLVMLGLSKLARSSRTPLSVRSIVLSGYPCYDWMAEGIQNNLDCNLYGCYAIGSGPLLAGFSCRCNYGIHVRSDQYGLEIVDRKANRLPPGKVGEVILYPIENPSLQYDTLAIGEMSYGSCACGSKEPLLVNINPGYHLDPDIVRLGAEMVRWNSVLDFRCSKGEYGLEIEVITLPGEKRPEIPGCAKLMIRNWDPETDIPMRYAPGWYTSGYFSER